MAVEVIVFIALLPLVAVPLVALLVGHLMQSGHEEWTRLEHIGDPSDEAHRSESVSVERDPLEKESAK